MDLKRWLCNARGVNMTEVMVVLAIVGTMAAIGTPMFSSWLTTTRLGNTARDIGATLQTARTNAVTKSLEYRVRFDDTNQRYGLDRGNGFSDSTGWTAVQGDFPLPPGVSFGGFEVGFPTSSGAKALVISPEGGKVADVTKTSYTLTIKNNKDEKYDIEIVTRTGHVTIKKVP